MTGENGISHQPSDGLVAGIRRILRPLVRLLIARSLTFPWAANLLRAVYVEIALREFPVAGKRQTDSRITLLTGVHRKDVKRLRAQRRDTARPPRGASLGTQLIARWTGLPEYRDEQGAPRPLARLATAGEEHSFESLVRSLNTDIRPRVVLDEWLRLGLVTLDEADRVCLEARAFIPRQGSEAMAYFFGRNLHDHIAAAAHNLLGEPPPFLDRSVNYNHLTPESVAELSELARRRAMEVLQELNARALELQQRDGHGPTASWRFNLGVYLFREDQTPTDESSDEPK
ncbi:hypothetical protein KF840_18170 [bacterium]|nr:hypothetical protein [bacterium]